MLRERNSGVGYSVEHPINRNIKVEEIKIMTDDFHFHFDLPLPT